MTEKTTVKIYSSGEGKLSESYTSLIPRVGDKLFINRKTYIVNSVVWLEDHVEIYCTLDD